MPDSSSYKVSAIALKIPAIGGTLTAGLINHTSSIVYDGVTFSSATEIDFKKMGKVSMGLDNKSFKVNKIPAASGGLFGNIYDGIQYGHVEVHIYEITLDIDTSAVISAQKIIKGLLYNSSARIDSRILNLEIKEDKYYFDKIGGVRCTEQCSVKNFGDKICKKTVTSVTGTVLSVVGTILTLTATPAGDTRIYNNGYIELDGLRIKIALWESGAVFSMAEIPPASWVTEAVSVFIGCDKTLQSCRDIHDNENEFFGLGHSMVDYNALYEET